MDKKFFYKSRMNKKIIKIMIKLIKLKCHFNILYSNIPFFP